jgi:hypothetical protein
MVVVTNTHISAPPMRATSAGLGGLKADPHNSRSESALGTLAGETQLAPLLSDGCWRDGGLAAGLACSFSERLGQTATEVLDGCDSRLDRERVRLWQLKHSFGFHIRAFDSSKPCKLSS